MILSTIGVIVLTICVIAFIGVFLILVPDQFPQDRILTSIALIAIIIISSLLTYNYTMVNVYENQKDINTTLQYKRWTISNE